MGTLRQILLLFCCAIFIASECRADPEQPAVVPADEQCRNSTLQVDRSWLIFFGNGSSVLTDRAAQAARELAEVFSRNHGQFIVVEGQVDGAEVGTADPLLGMQRAEAVATVLKEHGISSYAIATKNYSFSRPLVPNENGPEPQNRYVRLVPVGVVEGRLTFERKCAAAIERTCFRSLGTEQREHCNKALELLVAPD